LQASDFVVGFVELTAIDRNDAAVAERVRIDETAQFFLLLQDLFFLVLLFCLGLGAAGVAGAAGAGAAACGAGCGCVTAGLWPAACGPLVPWVLAWGVGPLRPDCVGAPCPDGCVVGAAGCEGGAATAVCCAGVACGAPAAA